MLPYIVAAVIGFVVLLWMMNQGVSVARAVSEAVAAKDIAPITETAKNLPEQQRSQFFQEATTQLWDGWHRDLAAKVAKEFVIQHPEERICQYWLHKVMEVEPETAGEILDEDFLKNYYLPEVGAACGVKG